MPDVEKKAFDITSNRAKLRQQQQHQEVDPEPKHDQIKEEETDEPLEDLIRTFTACTLQKNFVCQPDYQSNVSYVNFWFKNKKPFLQSTHISCLPMEVLIHILKWVVSSDLDTRSLENFSEVCRGFYLAARSSDIWRLICLRTWGVKVLPIGIKKKVTNNDWRSFFLSRPRVHLNGCYISKMTYMREGERSFTDHQFYRAWHVVQYFRLIRFFPGGFMVMNTTADNPAEAVKVMTEGLVGGYTGRYQTIDNRVVCVVKKIEAPIPPPTFKRRRNSRKPYTFEVPDQVLHFVSFTFL